MNFINRKSLVLAALLLIVAAGCGGQDTPTAQVPENSPTAVVAQTTPTAPPTQPAPTATEAAQPAETASPEPTSAPTEAMEPAPTTEATPEPTAAPPTEVAAPANQGCNDQAAFYADVTVPDGTSFSQGESFTKIWQVRNTGTCSWNEAYRLIFAAGSTFGAAMESQMPQAAPGEIVDISLDMTAPARGGNYTSSWLIKNDRGESFGVGASGHGPLWAEINISFVSDSSGGSGTTPPASSGSGSITAPAGCDALRDQAFESDLMNTINNARAANGLNTLSWNDELAAAALAHSVDMACNNFVDHVGSDGSLWYDRVSAQGYANYNSARENIRVGSPDFGFTPQYVYDQWFISQIHHDNMFFKDISEIGVGYVFNPNSEFGGYATVVFARP